jgi:hypothetical protein
MAAMKCDLEGFTSRRDPTYVALSGSRETLHAAAAVLLDIRG